MTNDPPWRLEIRRDWPGWSLYAMYRYSGIFIGWFWWKSSADRAAKNLTRFIAEMPVVIKREKDYDDWMGQCKFVVDDSNGRG